MRHPGDFVRTGIRREYYRGNEKDDSRITPLADDEIYNSWANLSDIQKIGWLWNTTNDFIENEKVYLNDNKCGLLPSNPKKYKFKPLEITFS